MSTSNIETLLNIFDLLKQDFVKIAKFQEDLLEMIGDHGRLGGMILEETCEITLFKIFYKLTMAANLSIVQQTQE